MKRVYSWSRVASCKRDNFSPVNGAVYFGAVIAVGFIIAPGPVPGTQCAALDHPKIIPYDQGSIFQYISIYFLLSLIRGGTVILVLSIAVELHVFSFCWHWV